MLVGGVHGERMHDVDVAGPAGGVPDGSGRAGVVDECACGDRVELPVAERGGDVEVRADAR